MTTRDHSFRLPIWTWIILALVLAGFAWWGVGFARERAGINRLRAYCDDLQQSGQGAFIEDLLPSIPPLDDARQEQAWMLIDRWKLLPDPQLKDQELDAFIDGRENDAPAWRKHLEASRTLLAEWDSLSASGPLRLDASGWLRQDLATHRITNYNLRIPNLLGMRWWWQGLHAQVVLTDHPNALAAYDRFHGSLQSGCLIDAMIATALANDRDRTYLELERLGRLSIGERQRWVGETVNFLPVIAEAYRWERLAFSGGLTKSLLKDGSLNLRMLGTPSAPSWMHQLGEIGEKLAEFTAGPFYMPLGDDLRFGQEVLRTAERRLRGESLAETPIPTNARISGMAVPNLFECGFTAVQANATAVRTRLAARLIADHRAGQPLPVDEPAFLARYGATCLDVPNGPRQHYERLSERRFRLSTPKTSPATTFFDPARITAISPPPTDERSVFAGWHVEITVRDSTPSSALPAGSTPASPQDSHP